MSWSRIGLFYGVAWLGPLGSAALLLLLRPGLGTLTTAITAAAMLGPLLGTVVAQRVHGERPLTGLGARPRLSWWLAAAAIVPLAVAYLAMWIGPQLPGAAWDWGMSSLQARFAGQLTPEQLTAMVAQMEALPVHPVWLALPSALVAGFTINGVAAFAEEIGWRGWLERELAPLGFWRAVGLTGVLWGLWHAPLILLGHNYPDHPVAGVGMFVVITVLLSPWLSFVRRRARTVWAAAVFHGVFNGAGGVASIVVSGSDLVVGVPGLAGALALLVANGVLVIVFRPHQAVLHDEG